MISKRRAKSNILAVYHAATEYEHTAGREWYHTAHQVAYVLGRDYGVSTDTAAAILAHLSPSNRWTQNVKDAETVLAAYAAGTLGQGVTVSTYPAAVDRCMVTLGTSANPLDCFGPKAHKTRSFAALIADPFSDLVCIDGHAWNILHGVRVPLKQAPSLSAKGRYGHAVNCYRSVAESLGLAGSTVQAVTWLAWRRIHKTTRGNK